MKFPNREIIGKKKSRNSLSVPIFRHAHFIALFYGVCVKKILYKKSLPLMRVQVSDGHLCEAEAPTKAAAETVARRKP